MTEYIIEKGIAPPGARARFYYPLADMEIGDSFFVPGKGFGIWAHFSRRAKRLGIELATRVEGTGVRVWRVK